MIIENVESLKAWLIQTLTPVCDADPDTLAKYVVALVKKDKPMEELMDNCNKELDIFLQDKTKSFVSKLFDVLQSRAYIVVMETMKEKNVVASAVPVETKPEKEKGTILGATQLAAPPKDYKMHPRRNDDGVGVVEYKPTTLTERRDRPKYDDVYYKDKLMHDAGSAAATAIAAVRRGSPPPPLMKALHRRDAYQGHPGHPVSDLQGRAFDEYKSPMINESRSRRAKTPPYARPDKSMARPLSPGSIRNSVLSRARYQDDRRRRYPSLEKVPGRYTSPLRSPESERIGNMHHPYGRLSRDQKYENVRPPAVRPAARPARSPAPLRSRGTRSRTGSQTPSLDRVSQPRKRSRSNSLERSKSRSASPRSPNSRASSVTSKCSASKRIYVEKAPIIDSRSSTPLEEDADKNIDPVQLSVLRVERTSFRTRCRDYDEKGYCIRGDLCPYDHGADPVIVNENELPSMRPFQPGMQVGGLGGLMPKGLVQEPPHSRPMPPPPHPGATLLPNMSRPPPMLPFQPLPPQAHYMTPHMLPPNYYRPPLVMRTGPGLVSSHEMFRPTQVDPYMPEPYTPKAPPFRLVTPLESDNWTSASEVQLGGYPQQRNATGLLAAGRHANLVRVQTQEKLPDDAATVHSDAGAGIRVGVKRKFDGGEQETQTKPVATGVTTDITQPSPAKKTVLEHPGVRHGGGQVSNTTLELRKIPRDQNTIANINDHFSKFGIIVNLQVGWEGDSQAALVSFASNAQAAAAYRSQEPFLNNRFIKIFWHNSEKPQAQQSTAPAPVAASEPQRPRHIFPERHQLHLNNKLKKTPISDTRTVIKTLVTKESKPVVPLEPIDKQQQTTNELKPVVDISLTRLQRKPGKEIARKQEVLKKKIELQKQSQLLLQKYLDQQKLLFEKLDKNKMTMTPEERSAIVQTIKKLAANIENLKTTLSSATSLKSEPAIVVGARKVTPSVARGGTMKINNIRRSLSGSGKISPGVKPGGSPRLALPASSIYRDSKQTQKAILDTELDLMTYQKEGVDTQELRQRVLALKKEALSLGLINATPQRGRGRGAGMRGRGVGRGGSAVGRRWSSRYPSSARTVDRRPKELVVTGFEADDKEELIAHVSSFGTLDRSTFDPAVPLLVVSFQSRSSAEKLAGDGCNFKNKKLTMVWQKTVLSELNTGNDRRDAFPTKGISESKENVTAGETKLKKCDLSATVFCDDANKPTTFEVDKKSTSGSGVLFKAQDSSVTVDEDDDDLLGIDEEDDDDEEERPWRR